MQRAARHLLLLLAIVVAGGNWASPLFAQQFFPLPVARPFGECVQTALAEAREEQLVQAGLAGQIDGRRLSSATDSLVAKRLTAPAREQTPVDFNHPPREYVTHELHGWLVFVEKQLTDEAPELAGKSLARLEGKLAAAVALLPAAALPDLRSLKVFLLYGPRSRGGGRDNGLEYFRASDPKHHDWLDRRMGRSVVIYDAANFAAISEQWAIRALVHEFGHAQHLEHWPEDRADIFDAWDQAVKAGRFREVHEEDRHTHNPNYAARNHLEYFAELTATYFVGVEYFPRDRAGLERYDPVGYALIENLWGNMTIAR